MAISDMAGTELPTAAAGPNWSPRRYGLVYLALAMAFILFDIVDGTLFSGDIDDLLREVEIRNFVDGAGWFDLSVPRVWMPEVYVAPWSRLVDLPYALIVWSLQPFVGSEAAFSTAFNLWPPVMAAFYVLAVVATLRRLLPRASDLPLAMLVAVPVLSAISIWEFAPGRIDHHNMQILLLAVLLYGISRWDYRGGWVAGIAVAVSFAVGLEAMPVLAAALLGVCVAWIAGAAGSRAMLLGLGLSAAMSALSLAAALIAPQNYLVMHSDAFSAPYVVALVGFGLVSASICLCVPGRWDWRARSAAFAVGGIFVVATVLVLYPAMIDGPLPMISGLARTYWFDRIDQEKGLIGVFSTIDQRATGQMPVLVGLVALSMPIAWRAARRSRPALPVIFAIAAAAFLMACFTTRFLRIAPGVVAILFPFAMIYLVSPDFARRGKQLLVAGVATLFLLAGVRIFIILPAPKVFDAFDYFVMYDCRNDDFSRLDALPAGRMITAPSLGLRILHRNNPQLAVSAIPFHRASPAMTNALQIMMGRRLSDNAALVAGYDYLALCRMPRGLPNEQAMPLLADLLAGKPVAGLELLSGKDAVMLYRIDHAALR